MRWNDSNTEGLWIVYAQQTNRKRFCGCCRSLCGQLFCFTQATFLVFCFRKWYLWRLKPQEIKPISKSRPSKPLLRALV